MSRRGFGGEPYRLLGGGLDTTRRAGLHGLPWWLLVITHNQQVTGAVRLGTPRPSGLVRKEP